MRAAFGDPQESLLVQGEAMGECEHPGPEAVHQIPVEVELQDRVQVGPGTLVGPATIQDPEVFAIRIRNDAADDAQGAALGELLPAEGRPVGVAGSGLR